MVTDNVYFNWKFTEQDVYCTNSPIVEIVYQESGDYLVSLNITNPGKVFLILFYSCLIVYMEESSEKLIRCILYSKFPFRELRSEILFYSDTSMEL